MQVTPDYFRQTGLTIMGWANTTSHSITMDRQFRASFGTHPLLCHQIWNLINNGLMCTSNNCARPKHLLWALLFLKQYNTTEINSALVGEDEKTFRKWSWIVINSIAELDLVSTVIVLIKSKYI